VASARRHERPFVLTLTHAAAAVLGLVAGYLLARRRFRSPPRHARLRFGERAARRRP